MITNVELLQTLYTHAMQHGMKQTETSLANATLKKFAELIVQECATLAYDGPNGILEHFGVKE